MSIQKMCLSKCWKVVVGVLHWGLHPVLSGDISYPWVTLLMEAHDRVFDDFPWEDPGPLPLGLSFLEAPISGGGFKGNPKLGNPSKHEKAGGGGRGAFDS